MINRLLPRRVPLDEGLDQLRGGVVPEVLVVWDVRLDLREAEARAAATAVAEAGLGAVRRGEGLLGRHIDAHGSGEALVAGEVPVARRRGVALDAGAAWEALDADAALAVRDLDQALDPAQQPVDTGLPYHRADPIQRLKVHCAEIPQVFRSLAQELADPVFVVALDHRLNRHARLPRPP